MRRLDFVWSGHVYYGGRSTAAISASGLACGELCSPEVHSSSRKFSPHGNWLIVLADCKINMCPPFKKKKNTKKQTTQRIESIISPARVTFVILVCYLSRDFYYVNTHTHTSIFPLLLSLSHSPTASHMLCPILSWQSSLFFPPTPHVSIYSV